MILAPTPHTADEPNPYLRERMVFPALCWGAVAGGTLAAVGIHILLTALGVGAGLAVFTPMTDTNPVSSFSIGAAIVWTVCALVALGFGGLIAGRFSHSLHGGFVHGVLVWSVTMIITVLMLSMGTGMVLGGALRVLGEGLGVGGRAVAAVAGTVADGGIKRGADHLGSFIDEAVHSGPTNAAPRDTIRATREIGFAVTKFFAPGNDPASLENRSAVVGSLTNYAGMDQTAATKAVDEWSASHKALRTELENAKAMAEQKARLAADKAAENLSCAAIWSFFALLAGLLVTAFAGSYGARHALLCAEIQKVPLN